MTLFVGLLILTVAGSMPYLGGLVRPLVLLAGLGLGLRQVARFVEAGPQRPS